MVEAGAPVTTSMLAARPVHRLVVQRPDYYRYRNRVIIGTGIEAIGTCLWDGPWTA
jgi:hypothetical protein